MVQNIDIQKSKVQTLEGILEKKNGQLTALKENLKIAEALNYGIKNVSKKIDDILAPKKPDVFALLAEEKISPAVYKMIDDILGSVDGILKTSGQESEKILYTRQCEINFLQQDIAQLKTEIAGAITVLADLERVPDSPPPKKDDYIRPDKNPNTRAGRASMDLAARKAAWKEKMSAEEPSVIVEEGLVVEEEKPEPVVHPAKGNKGKKKMFNLF